MSDVLTDATSWRREPGRGQYDKLTQEVRPDDSDPSVVLLTNMSLSASEHGQLSALAGHVVVKTRVVVSASACDVVVDEFHGRLTGLRLAEVEVRDLAERLDLPEWLGAEVTRDDRFPGGHLAVADDVRVRELLRPR